VHASFRGADENVGIPPQSLTGEIGRLDPSILHTAKAIYQGYRANRTKDAPIPLGVAIDRFTHRGQLVFTERPILLPQECFITVQQLESNLGQ
jgi:hypothetical protein